MIVKASFLVVASITAFAVSQINSNSRWKQSPILNPPDGAFMESEKVEEEEEEEPTNSDIPDEDKKVAKIMRSKMLTNVTDINMLSYLTRELEQRKVTLEGKLLELYGLKEEKAYKAQLQRSLKEKSTEIDMFNGTLASLQAEKMSLKEELKQGTLAKKKLETAKRMIVEMRRKIDANARSLGQVLMIQERVFGFRVVETSERDALIEQKLKDAENVELEVVKMKRINKEFELEKRELAVKLIAAQARITSLSHMTESKVLSKIEDEMSLLRLGNEELSRQIENLHKDRFNMVEELVYQRWLQSCLRFEIRNPPRETSKQDLRKNTLMNAEEKISIKPPLSYTSSNGISSHSSSSTESDQTESSTTIGSSPSSQNSIRKSSSLMRRIKYWGRRSKDDSNITSSAENRRNFKKKAGLTRRFSTSMVPVNSSTQRKQDESAINNPLRKQKEQELGESSEKSMSCPRMRRVSFSNLVKKDSIQSSDDDNTCYKLRTGFEGKENSEEKPEVTLVATQRESSETSMEISSSKKLSLNLIHEENKVEIHMVHLFATLFFLLLFFLAYLLQLYR